MYNIVITMTYDRGSSTLRYNIIILFRDDRAVFRGNSYVCRHVHRR